jgi:hypothetical protein
MQMHHRSGREGSSYQPINQPGMSICFLVALMGARFVALFGRRMLQRGMKMARFGPGRSVLIQPKDRNLKVRGNVDCLTGDLR